MYHLYIRNLLHTLNKVAKTEAHKTFAIEVQNFMYVSHLLYLEIKMFITIDVQMSEKINI
jgi:hypothetical protein